MHGNELYAALITKINTTKRSSSFCLIFHLFTDKKSMLYNNTFCFTNPWNLSIHFSLIFPKSFDMNKPNIVTFKINFNNPNPVYQSWISGLLPRTNSD